MRWDGIGLRLAARLRGRWRRVVRVGGVHPPRSTTQYRSAAGNPAVPAAPRLPAVRVDIRRPGAAGVVRRRGEGPRPGRRTGPGGQPVGLVGVAVRGPAWGGGGVTPGLGAGRRRVRRTARGRVRVLRSGRAAVAGVRTGPAGRGGLLRRRGGRPLRRRLRRLPVADRGAAGRPRARPDRCRRGDDGRRADPRRGRARGGRPGRRGTGPGRHVRGAAPGTGPRAGGAGPAGGGRLLDLGTRPVAARPARRGQPRRHHPAGRPAGPDAGAGRRDPRRPAGGRGPRRRRHRRQGRRDTERGERDPVLGDCLAGRPRARDRRGGGRGRRRGRGRAGRGVVHPGHPVRPGAGGTPVRTARGRPGARHRCRARRRDPRRRRCPRRDAVRPQPDRGVALAGRACRAGRLPGRHRCAGRGDRRPCLRAGLRAGLRPGLGPDPVTAYWAEHAWLPDGPARDVTLEIAGGRFVAVTAGTRPAGAQRLPGVVLPGFADVHSHAFHRALRGRTGAGAGTFWSWRQGMYAVAGRLDPDAYLALARALYAELALSGVAAVGEFHYLHHAPGGVPYADPNAMAEALRQAAADAGVRLTLLDTCYLAGGLTADGYAPLTGVQLRFGDADAEAWAARVARLRPSAGMRVGAAVHSVRAVPPAAVPAVVAAGGPLHVHLSEQPAENAACLAMHGRTPTALLAACGALGPRTTAVHATHLTAEDVGTLAATGTGVCFCPSTEADLADGIGPAAALRDAGVPLCLGTDQHVSADLLAEARDLELHQRLATGRRGTFAPAELVIALTGHAALGWHDAGGLAAGARADLVALALDTPRTAGADPEQAVLAATAGDVRTVLVDGRIVVADGRHVLGDVGRLLA